MRLIFAQKYKDNRPQNTCVSSDKCGYFLFSQGKVMRYFRPFESYTKCSVFAQPKKITRACLCLLDVTLL